MCGICQCAPDYFGRKCECDINFITFFLPFWLNFGTFRRFLTVNNSFYFLGECDSENVSFHGDLEAGCRPDNTTTTLCNNRGDCMCGKCECYPRPNPNEVN